MKLIGVMTGVYNDTPYAKVICTEDFLGSRQGCYGTNAFVDKAQYVLVTEKIIPNIQEYIGKDVLLYYDRYERVQEIKVVE